MNKLQVANAKDLKNATQLEQLLENSFLQPWLLKGLHVRGLIGESEPLADFAVFNSKQLLLFIEQSISITHIAKNTKEAIENKRIELIHEAHKRFQKTLQYFNNEQTDVLNADNQPIHVVSLEDIDIFCVCVTNIKLEQAEKTTSIKHRYGSAYLQTLELAPIKRECIQNMHVVSFLNLLKCIEVLSTVSDFTDFLRYQDDILNDKVSFADEVTLLKNYISSGSFLERARRIENNLLAKKLRPRASKSLGKKEATKHLSDFKTLKKQAQFWEHIIHNFAKQIVQLNKVSGKHRDMLSALMSESIYSRNILSDCLHDFKHASKQRQEDGYLVHMRSYSHENRHYVFVFYAKDSAKKNHRSQAKDKLKNIASAVNFMEQNPPLDEIFVMGIESNDDGFETDTFFVKGKKLSEEEIAEAKAAQTTKYMGDITVKQTSRNALCDCGSGKKFKHCHGAIN